MSVSVTVTDCSYVEGWFTRVLTENRRYKLGFLLYVKGMISAERINDYPEFVSLGDLADEKPEA